MGICSTSCRDWKKVSDSSPSRSFQPPPNPPRRERLSIWKVSEERNDLSPAEMFMQMYNSTGRGDFRRTISKDHRDLARDTEEKDAQGTLILMESEVLIEGALSLHAQSQFEEKKMNVSGGKIPKDYLEKLGIAVTCKKGLKPESPNQDDYSILIDKSYWMFGVFDGHGNYGHNIANYIHALMLKLVSNHAEFPYNPLEAFKDSFRLCQEHLEIHCDHPETIYDCSISGTTATLTLIREEKLYMGHVGDSRAVLGRICENNTRKAVMLSEDHKPNLPDELSRIESCKGEVRIIPETKVHRVFRKGQDFPGLAMSRAIGDRLAREIGVISEPSVLELNLNPEDEFIVICSDGVWEFMNDQQVVDVIAEYGRERVTEAAADVAKRAWEEWIRIEGDVVDDITVMIVYLKKKAEGGPTNITGNPTNSSKIFG